MAKTTKKMAKDRLEYGSIQSLVDDGPLYDETPLPALRRRRIWKKTRWVVWLLLMVPFVYLAVQVFIILAPQMRTEVALLDTMTDSLQLTGQVVFTNVPVEGGAGAVFYVVEPGQRVAVGAEVAMVFASDTGVQAMDMLKAIEAELEMLAEAQQTVVEGGDLEAFLAQMQAGVYDLVAGLENGDYAGLDSARAAIALAANKMQISTGEAPNFEARISELNAMKSQYEALAVPQEVITAPETGYFSPAPQNNRVLPAYETAAGFDASQWQLELTAPPVYQSDDVIGYIVQDYKWHFFTLCGAHEAERFTPGDKSLEISFPDVGDAAMPVTVERVSVEEEEGLAVVELYCEYLRPEIMQLRVEEANLIFGTQKGIRIEKNALRLMDVKNDDGSVSTYKGVYVQFGNMVYFRRISILVEDEFYLLVSDAYDEGVNEVRLYDKVVVDSGGIELYDRKIL